jgi:hypothetical protein
MSAHASAHAHARAPPPEPPAAGGLPAPDPERWLPKWERAEFKRRRAKGRGKDGVKGSQGAGKVDENLDRTKVGCRRGGLVFMCVCVCGRGRGRWGGGEQEGAAGWQHWGVRLEGGGGRPGAGWGMVPHPMASIPEAGG